MSDIAFLQPVQTRPFFSNFLCYQYLRYLLDPSPPEE
jgi:hypothetical protein